MTEKISAVMYRAFSAGEFYMLRAEYKDIIAAYFFYLRAFPHISEAFKARYFQLTFKFPVSSTRQVNDLLVQSSSL